MFTRETINRALVNMWLPLTRLPSQPYAIPHCNGSKNLTHLQGDFSSSAEFFVCVGVLGFLYCTFTIVLYLGYQQVYRESNRGPTIVSHHSLFYIWKYYWDSMNVINIRVILYCIFKRTCHEYREMFGIKLSLWCRIFVKIKICLVRISKLVWFTVYYFVANQCEFLFFF